MTNISDLTNMQQRCVLVVDDIEDNCVLLDRFLKMSGYETILCDSGSAALSIISQRTPDIILLDWMMPGLTGLETLRAIRETHDGARLPVIMCTAIEEEMSVVTAINAGANDYMTKPISLPILRARMTMHLGQRAVIHSLNNQRATVENQLTEQTRELLRVISDRETVKPFRRPDEPQL
jgi:DNA-binding response OmpR family regulator